MNEYDRRCCGWKDERIADLERQIAEAKALLVLFVKAHTVDLEAVFGGSDVPDSIQLHEEGLTVGDLRRARSCHREHVRGKREMTDPVEVIARAICRCFCPCITEERTCYDWEGSLPEASAALAALEGAGMAVVPVEPTTAMLEAGRYAKLNNTSTDITDWIEPPAQEDLLDLGIKWPDMIYDRWAIITEELHHLLLETAYKGMLVARPR